MQFLSEEMGNECLKCIYNLTRGIHKNVVVCFFPKCKGKEILPKSMKETRSETPDDK